MLHAMPDDLLLNALADTDVLAVNVVSIYNLTDPSGNRLTDPSGNYLVVYIPESINAKVLRALPDTLLLHAE